MQKMKTGTWCIAAAGWYLLSAGAFILSERFADNNIVLYSSVAVLLLAMLLGPGMLALTVPFSGEPGVRDENYRRHWWIAYPVCWGLFALTAKLLAALHWV